MVKIFECGSVVPGCKFVIHAEERDDALDKAVEHLHSVHDIEHFSAQLKERICAVIRDASVRPIG